MSRARGVRHIPRHPQSRHTHTRVRSECRNEYVQLVDVRVEYLVHEPDAGRLERVLIWELDVDLPHATGERGCSGTRVERM